MTKTRMLKPKIKANSQQLRAKRLLRTTKMTMSMKKMIMMMPSRISYQNLLNKKNRLKLTKHPT